MAERLRRTPGVLRPSPPKQSLRRRLRSLRSAPQAGVRSGILRRQNPSAGRAGNDKVNSLLSVSKGGRLNGSIALFFFLPDQGPAEEFRRFWPRQKKRAIEP